MNLKNEATKICALNCPRFGNSCFDQWIIQATIKAQTHAFLWHLNILLYYKYVQMYAK